MADAPTPLAAVLVELRTKAQMTQAELASVAGVSDSQIAHAESGRRNLSRNTVDAIVEMLGLRGSGWEGRLNDARAATAGQLSTADRVDDLESKLRTNLKRRAALLEGEEGRSAPKGSIDFNSRYAELDDEGQAMIEAAFRMAEERRRRRG